jgi:hypothetical protein
MSVLLLGLKDFALCLVREQKVLSATGYVCSVLFCAALHGFSNATGSKIT